MYVKLNLGCDKMYGYIIGKVTEYDKNCIILENNNIGYLINVSNPYSYKLNEIIKVYIYNHIKEDENSLYGFKNNEEKDLFLRLIDVKGIGPKMALPILAGNNIKGVYDAINEGNVSYLMKFPKIGEKVAKQIILDLKGKLSFDSNIKSENSELVEVLESLGYKSIEVKKILNKIDNSLSLEDQIKESLKLLGK